MTSSTNTATFPTTAVSSIAISTTPVSNSTASTTPVTTTNFTATQNAAAKIITNPANCTASIQPGIFFYINYIPSKYIRLEV